MGDGKAEKTVRKTLMFLLLICCFIIYSMVYKQTNKKQKKKTQNKTTHRVRVVVVFGLSFGGFCVQSFCQGFFQVAFHHVCFPVSQSKQGKPSFQHLYD